jgi:Cu+-exporting ATPase
MEKNHQYKGQFLFESSYRKGVFSLLNRLKQHFRLLILSGDNIGEKQFLTDQLQNNIQMGFD